jgi:hypothetical protein
VQVGWLQGRAMAIGAVLGVAGVCEFDLGLDAVTADLVSLTTGAPMCPGEESVICDSVVLGDGGPVTPVQALVQAEALPDVGGLVSVEEAVQSVCSMSVVGVDKREGVHVDLSDSLPFSLDEASLLSDAELGRALDEILKGDWGKWVPEKLPPCPEVDTRASGFLGPDPKFKEALSKGGNNPSRGSDQWALNRIKAFLVASGMQSSVELVDMRPRDVCKILCLFFEQAARQDGRMYPAGTLMNLLQTIGRVLRRAQEVRVMATGIYEPPFNIKESVVFKEACLACCLAMERSRQAGVGVTRKKVGVRWLLLRLFLKFCPMWFGVLSTHTKKRVSDLLYCFAGQSCGQKNRRANPG